VAVSRSRREAASQGPDRGGIRPSQGQCVRADGLRSEERGSLT
jgi:hypothetical protein